MQQRASHSKHASPIRIHTGRHIAGILLRLLALQTRVEVRIVQRVLCVRLVVPRTGRLPVPGARRRFFATDVAELGATVAVHVVAAVLELDFASAARRGADLVVFAALQAGEDGLLVLGTELRRIAPVGNVGDHITTGRTGRRAAVRAACSAQASVRCTASQESTACLIRWMARQPLQDPPLAVHPVDWLDVPFPRLDLELFLDRGRDGVGVVGHVQSVLGPTRRVVALVSDGQGEHLGDAGVARCISVDGGDSRGGLFVAADAALDGRGMKSRERHLGCMLDVEDVGRGSVCEVTRAKSRRLLRCLDGCGVGRMWKMLAG